MSDPHPAATEPRQAAGGSALSDTRSDAPSASPGRDPHRSPVRDVDELRAPLPRDAALRSLGKGQISFQNRIVQNGLMTLDLLLYGRTGARWVAERRHRVRERIQAEIREKPAGKLYEIPRRPGLGPEEFYHQYLRPGLPVVLEGAADDWPCRHKWSLQFLADRYGDDEVAITDGQPPASQATSRSFVRLREVVENNDPEHKKYLRFHPILALHPELTADIPLDWFERYKRRKSLYSRTVFFVGTRGTTTGLHNAQPGNLFAMIQGEKLWQLYPTNYTAFLDPVTSHSIYRVTRFSGGDGSEPLMRQLDGYQVHLRAGDVLWVPPFWWHSVHNLTDSIAVSYRWNDHMLSMKMHPTMFLLDFLARDPSWWTTFKTGRSESRRMRTGQAGGQPSGQPSGQRAGASGQDARRS